MIKAMNTGKFILRIFICMFLGMSVSVSCIPGNLLDNIMDAENPDNTDEPENPGEEEVPEEKDPQIEASNAIRAKFPALYAEGYIALYDHMPPGIYEYIDSDSDAVMLIAKSTDGGGFHIQDVNDERADPTFTELGIPGNYFATDGQRKGYFFDRSLHNFDNDLRIFRDTARYAVIDEYLTREALFGMEDVLHAHSPRAMDVAIMYAFHPLYVNNSTVFHNESFLISETGREKVAGHDCTVYSITMNLSAIGMVRKYQDLYVMDNGVCAKCVSYNMDTGEGTVDFVLSYADTDVGDFNDVFTKIHRRHCTGSLVFPDRMIPQYTKYADEWLHSWYSIPAMAVYEGKGTIRRMSVTRTYNWKPYDNVCTVEVVIDGATFNEAVSYIEKAEKAAGINLWDEDENIIEPNLEYVLYKSWFDPCLPSCTHELGSTAVGFKYVVTYINGLLTIIFDVTHTGHV